MMIPDELIPAFEQYTSLDKQIKQLEKTKAALKEKILEWQKGTGQCKIEDRGYTSTLTEAIRRSLVEAKIVEHFGALPADCIRETPYMSIRIYG